MVVKERLERLPSVRLARGAHQNREEGMCALEAVAWLAGEPHSFAPRCACPVVGTLVIGLNDSWGEEARQALRAFLPRIVGSRGSQQVEERRRWMAADWLFRSFTPEWLWAVGLSFTEAVGFKALEPIVDDRSLAAAAVAAELAMTPAMHHAAISAIGAPSIHEGYYASVAAARAAGFCGRLGNDMGWTLRKHPAWTPLQRLLSGTVHVLSNQGKADAVALRTNASALGLLSRMLDVAEDA